MQRRNGCSRLNKTRSQREPITVRYNLVLASTSYVIGAVPFSQIVSMRYRGIDLRSVGTGTVSGTGLYRVGGFAALVVGGGSDVAKGALAATVAGRGSDFRVLACTAVVSGHCWSVFLRGAGGRGISPAIGALVVLYWPGAAVLLAGLAIGRLVRETGLVSLMADLVLIVVMPGAKGRSGLSVALATVAPMLFKRILGNALPEPRSELRIYRDRLLFDADQHHAA
jgi:glycerol-3-phosphate acyltransferase PlsY